MKRMFLFSFVLLVTSNLFSQNVWNQTWKSSENPFQPLQSDSEFNIIKSGFDTDEDGWGEFVTAFCDKDSNFIMMYEASANDTYDLVWSWRYPVTSNSWNGIAIGDMDNNGVVEIITAIPSIATATESKPPRLWVFEWNGIQGENKYGNYVGDACTPHSVWDYDIEENKDVRPLSLLVEDIDGDGKNELITGMRQGDPDKELFVSSVTGTFTTFANWNNEFHLPGLQGGTLSSVTTGDLDGDGNREIHVSVWDMFTLLFIESTGPDTYEVQSLLQEVFSPIDYGVFDGISVADADNDGTNELYYAGHGVTGDPAQTIFIITDINDVNSIEESDVQKLLNIPTQDGGNFKSMQICDPDEDGNINLMIVGRYSGQIHDLEYNGVGDPTDSTSWTLTEAFDIFDLCAADVGIDADSAMRRISPELFYGNPAGDMDQDGKNEFVFTNYSTDFADWENDAYIWVLEAGTALGIALDNSSVPSKISLEQNYPNPFNPNTKIHFGISDYSNVKITVYDILGNEIDVILDSQMTPGNYTVDFVGTGLSSGIYYYSLESNGKKLTREMLLMK